MKKQIHQIKHWLNRIHTDQDLKESLFYLCLLVLALGMGLLK